MYRISVTGFLLVASLIVGMTVAAVPSIAQVKGIDPKFPKDPKDPKDPKAEVKVDPMSENKWPTEIGGKKLDAWVKDMRESKDASMRDRAIRVVPNFGPDARKAASANLLHAIKEDVDQNVRLTAIAAVPVLGFDDPHIDAGLDAMVALIKPTGTSVSIANHTKYEVIMALGNCGPVAKRAIPTIAEVSIIDPRSYQTRKAAAFALGRLGMPMQTDPKSKQTLYPDPQAIHGLIRALKDSSHLVRQEAINSLIMLGKPDPEDRVLSALRQGLQLCFKDSDRSIALWARVLYIQLETKPGDPKDPNLKAIEAYLDDKDDSVRLEGIQALGMLGETAVSRVDRLLSIAMSTKEAIPLKGAAIWALPGMKSQTTKIVPVLQTLKDDKEKYIQSSAEAVIKILTYKEEPKKDDFGVEKEPNKKDPLKKDPNKKDVPKM